MKNDTIAAIATATGESGIGIVRLSGPDALTLAGRLVTLKSGKKPKTLSTHTIHYGHAADPATAEIIDEVILSVMKAPGTYTREDVAEINCHGGMISLRRTLEAAVTLGARLAEPGEFTKRAYLNGRIDLAQAEAVIDIIKAKTSESLKAAVNQLKGRLSAELMEITEELKAAAALVEANIEFPEEGLESTDLIKTGRSIKRAKARLQALAGTAEKGKILREGAKVSIIGRPNTGKSSLLNELLDEERAIVTHLPGTTRDVIEESINLDGIPFVLSDTAGIRESFDLIEKKGIQRTFNSIEAADAVILMLDGSVALSQDDVEAAKRACGKKALLVINKSDLTQKLNEKEAAKLLPGAKTVKISVLRAKGIKELKKALRGLIEEKGISGREDLIITNLRHKLLIEGAVTSLCNALESIEKGMSEEFIALDIRGALDHLGAITGKVSTDDIINKIFADFCVGK